jgi:FkbM family methyltransferase
MEIRYQRWLDEYVAPRPEHQAFCERVLRTGEGSTTPKAQDLILFFNLFKYWPLLNRTGYYVDSGAAHARDHSTTFFFDACLGWRGLCVEPQPEFHASLREQRTCALATACVSDVKRRARVAGHGVTAELVPDWHGETRCLPLGDLLAGAGWAGPVDFWSLDVEGHELAALRGAARAGVAPRALVVEDFWLSSPRALDRLLTEQGYSKRLQMPNDALYVRGLPPPPDGPPWLPAGWAAMWETEDRLRATEDAQARLRRFASAA